MGNQISNVPTNIITGFLGTGKTSTIQHLLSFKPEHERWAVLVNEFGAVGIDGTFYQSENSEAGGVFVREVPGGCMCCVSGLPMQIALNVLLKLSNPHRLLIEPSGLGHPVEVVALLNSEYYQDVLDIQKIITLIDPKQFIQDKYFNHPTYQQQLEIADVCVVNKTDVCSKSELDTFALKTAQSAVMPDNLFHSTHGRIDPDLLIGPFNFARRLDFDGKSKDIRISEEEWPDLPTIPEQEGYLVSSRFDEGFHVVSWRFLDDRLFDSQQLVAWVQTLKVERVKGVLLTDKGVIGINASKDYVQIDEFKEANESRLEIIAATIDSSWEAKLSECLLQPSKKTKS